MGCQPYVEISTHQTPEFYRCTLYHNIIHVHSNRHVIFAPSSVNSYGSSLFPGVSDTIFNAVNFGGSWEDVSRQLDFVRNHIRYATMVMAEPSLKYAPVNWYTFLMQYMQVSKSWYTWLYLLNVWHITWHYVLIYIYTPQCTYMFARVDV